MDKETKEKMDFWLSQHPESTHPLDEKRKFCFRVVSKPRQYSI